MKKTITETREKPILFSGPMVRAVLDGRKTQTRRIVKPQPYQDGEYPDGYPMWHWESKQLDAGYCHTAQDAMERLMLQCSPYVVGMRLWVRETWSVADQDGDGEAYGVCYRADGPEGWAHWPRVPESDHGKYGRRDSVNEAWRPSIFMPRWASRITLEVTGVRVERVCQISESDCLAEGFGDDGYCEGSSYPRAKFSALWDNINGNGNGKGSWDSNPWVWVIEFRKV